jgi:hypothetical protein
MRWIAAAMVVALMLNLVGIARSYIALYELEAAIVLLKKACQ